MREPASSLLLTGRRVLVVEDEYMTADDLRRYLERLGAHVVGPVAQVSDALRALGSEDALDGAILDVNLGNEKVFPVADELRARGIRFVFSTGYDESALPETYRNVPRCEKPVDFSQIVQALFE